MKLYIAAPFAARDVAVTTAATLEEAGHTVVSTWHESTREIHEGTIGTSPENDDDGVGLHAQKDLDDIKECDALIHLTGAYCYELVAAPVHWFHTGGRHVEQGYAMALGKDVHLIGEPENVFGRSFAYNHRSIGDFLEYIEKYMSGFGVGYGG